jgi:hypothetical protein
VPTGACVLGLSGAAVGATTGSYAWARLAKYNCIQSEPLAPVAALQDPIGGGRSRRSRFHAAQSKSASSH